MMISNDANIHQCDCKVLILIVAGCNANIRKCITLDCGVFYSKTITFMCPPFPTSRLASKIKEGCFKSWLRMFFGGINNVNGKLHIILAAMQNFRRFLGMKPLPPGAFVLPSIIPKAPFFEFLSKPGNPTAWTKFESNSSSNPYLDLISVPSKDLNVLAGLQTRQMNRTINWS